MAAGLKDDANACALQAQLIATDVFLRLNGWRLVVDPDEAHEFLIGLLETQRCEFTRLLPWIREHIHRL